MRRKKREPLDIFKRSSLRIPPGTGSEGIFENFRTMVKELSPDLARMLQFNPGDVVAPQATGQDFVAALTLAPDLWYLVHTDSVLPIDDQETTDSIMDALEDFLEDLGNVKPLKTLRDVAELGYTHPTWDTKSYYSNNGPYMIKAMRYEVRRAFRNISYGDATKNIQNYPSYLAFPIGQLGIMEILSIVRSSVDYTLNSLEAPITTWDKLLSPPHTELGYCPGDHIVTKGSLLGTEVIYPAIEFEGKESSLPHKWLRFWLADSDTKPYPGEFVGLLARPFPNHAWWFQETSPFLYSGNWYETEYYTSGIVLVVTEPTGEEVTNTYTVQVKDEQVDITSTDLKEYEVDDRVTVLKKTGVTTASFNWEGLGFMADVITNIDWYIIPITFYE